MTKYKTGSLWLVGTLILHLCFTMSVSAAQPPVVSQSIYVSSPLLNEFGQRLKGTDSGASYFGHEVVEGDIVHIYLATNGVIYPPNALGVADSRNSLLMESRIGRGSSAKEVNPGTFSIHMTPRPASGSKLFVRVFNAPSGDQTSFYMDSQLFTVSWTADNIFQAEFAAGIKPLDTADNDGDGVNNSWEKSHGTDLENADSDNDGLIDPDELIAGTEPTNSDSTFIVGNLQPISSEFMRLTWKSEVGRIYTVEKNEGINSGIFNVVDIVSGNGTDYELIVPGSTNAAVFYRIKVALQSITE